MNSVLFTFALLLALTTSIYGQHAELDSRLLAQYSESELNAKSPEEIKYLNFYVANACTIGNYTPEKGKDNNVGNVQVADLHDFNFFDLNIETPDEQPSYYQINNSNKVLIVRSTTQLKEMYKNATPEH